MHYQTRHLEALVDIDDGRQLRRPGDRFYATPIDADYHLATKRAIEVSEAVAAPSAPTPTPPVPRGGRRVQRATVEPPASGASTPVPAADAGGQGVEAGGNAPSGDALAGGSVPGDA